MGRTAHPMRHAARPAVVETPCHRRATGLLRRPAAPAHRDAPTQPRPMGVDGRRYQPAARRPPASRADSRRLRRHGAIWRTGGFELGSSLVTLGFEYRAGDAEDGLDAPGSITIHLSASGVNRGVDVAPRYAAARIRDYLQSHSC